MKGSKTFKGPSFLHHKTSLGRIQESITKESKTFMTWTEPEETPLEDSERTQGFEFVEVQSNQEKVPYLLYDGISKSCLKVLKIFRILSILRILRIQWRFSSFDFQSH